MKKEEQKTKDLAKYCHENDDLTTHGVLLSNEIEYYAEKYNMIKPFHRDNLNPAGYELTVGEDYAKDGKLRKLYDKQGKNELKIEPFEVVIIRTYEKINLPRFILARWNLRVAWVYEGLLWNGALQVDPGWVGHLNFPLYNLSNEEVTLKLGDPIVLMDFVKTTPFISEKSVQYNRPPKRKNLKDYNWKLRSALFTEAAKRIKEVEKRVSRFETIIGILFACIAILFAALSILVTSAKKVNVSFPYWLYFSVWLSILAIIVSISSWARRSRKKWWQEILLSSAILLIVIITFWLIKTFLW